MPVDYNTLISRQQAKYKSNTADAENLARTRAFQGYLNSSQEEDSLLNQINTSNTNIAETLKAADQSWYNKVGNAAAQTLFTALGNTVETVGAFGSLPGRIQTGFSKDRENFDNVVSEWGRNIEEFGKEAFPIHRENPEKNFDFGDVGYWASMAPSAIGSMLGMYAGGWGVMKLAGLGLKGAGLAGKINKALSPNALKLLEGGFQAGVMRDTENFMESHGVFAETYENLTKEIKEKGYDKFISEIPKELRKDLPVENEEELKNYIASAAGWHSYKTNAVNIIFDLVQVAGLRNIKIGKGAITGNVYGKSVKTMQEQLGRKLKSDIAKNIGFKAGKLTLEQGVTEGLEEGINAISQMAGMEYGKHLIGKQDKFFEDYLKDPSTWEQAMWGSIGGVAGGGLFKAIGKFANAKKNKDKQNEEISEIQGRALHLANLNSAFTKINKNIDPNTNTILTLEGEALESKKELLRDEQIAKMASAMAGRAIKTENIGLLLNYLKDENTIDKLTNLELGDKADVKNTLDKVSSIVEDEADFYATNVKGLNWSSIKNDYLKDVFVGDAMAARSDQKSFKARRDFAQSEKVKLESNNTYLNKLTAEERATIQEDISKLAKITALKELNAYVTQMKFKHKNNAAFTIAYNNKLAELEKKFNLQETDTAQSIVGRLQKHLTNDSIKDILEYSKEIETYDAAFDFKNIEIHEALHNKDIHKEVENKVKKDAAEIRDGITTSYVGRINSMVVEAANTIKNLDSVANNYQELTESTKNALFEKLDEIAKEDKFKITKLDIENTKKDFEIRLTKLASSPITSTPVENNVPLTFTGDELEHINNNPQMYEGLANETDEDLEDIKNNQIADYINNPQASKEAKEEAALSIRYIDSLLKERQKDNNQEIIDLNRDINNDNIVHNNGIVDRQGGLFSFNGYLGPAQNAILKERQNGIYVVNDNDVDAVAITMQLKAGTKITFRQANHTDFNSSEEYNRLFEESNGEIIVGTVAGVPVMFVNTEKYLVNEAALTDSVLQNLDNEDFEELFYAIKNYSNEKASEVSRLLALDTIKKNGTFITLYGKEVANINKKIEHLRNILFFGSRHDEVILDKTFLQNSLEDWYSKINRDYKNRPLIVDKVMQEGEAITTIAYSSSGNLIMASKNGKVTLLNVTQSLGNSDKDNDSVKLYTIGIGKRSKDVKKRKIASPHTLLPIITSDKKRINPIINNNKAYKQGVLYSSATGVNGTEIAIPLEPNTIKSKRTTGITPNDQKRIDFILAKGIEVLTLLNNGSALSEDKVQKLIDEIGQVVIVNRDNKDTNTYLQFHLPTEKTSAHMQFKTPYGQGEYQLYQDNREQTFGDLTLFKKVDKTATGNGVKIPAVQFKDEINLGFGNLTRSWDYDLLKANGKYTDIVTGKTHKSYKDYLLDTNVVLTHIGKIEDSQGNKISNFQVKPNVSWGQTRPLVVAVDTTFERKVYKKFKNSKEILSSVSQDKYKLIFDKLREIDAKLAHDFVEIEFREPSKDKERGGYDPNTNTIYFTKLINDRLDRFDETVIHEILHGIIANSPLAKDWVTKIQSFNGDLLATIESITNNTLAIDQNNKEEILKLLKEDAEIQQILKKINKNDKDYREGDFEEVITYGFTHKNFARLLQLIPSNKEAKESKDTFWTKLKNLIADIVKAITGYSKLDELTNILDDIFNITTTGDRANTAQTKSGETDTSNEGENKDDTEPETGDDFSDFIIHDSITLNDIKFDNILFTSETNEKEELKEVIKRIHTKKITEQDSIIIYNRLNDNLKTELKNQQILDKNFYEYFNKEVNKSEPSNLFERIVAYLKAILIKNKVAEIYKNIKNNKFTIFDDKTSFTLNNTTNFRKENLTILNKVLYRSIKPIGYNVKDTVVDFLPNLIKGRNYVEYNNINYIGEEKYKNREDAWRISNNLPQLYDTFEYIGKGALDYKDDFIPNEELGQEYYKIKNYIFNTNNLNKDSATDRENLIMGKFHLVKGLDEVGNYIMYKDRWDLEIPKNVVINTIINKTQSPFVVADKIYKAVYYDPVTSNPTTYYTNDKKDNNINIANELEEYIKNIDNINFDVDSNIKFDNIDYNNPIPLKGNEELYEHYKLLNKEGKIKILENNEDSKRFRDSLNRSPNYSFELKQASDFKWRIYIYNKQGIENIANKQLNLFSNIEYNKEDVDFVFQENLELSKIGTEKQYSDYLNTIFPESKVKDIVYHGTNTKFDKFQTFNDSNVKGVFYTYNKQSAQIFGKPLSLLINSQKPLIEEDSPMYDSISLKARENLKKNYDSVITPNEMGVVFEPEQTHILGSKQDIEGFKEFVNNNKNNKDNVSNILDKINNISSKEVEDRIKQCK